MTTSTVAPFSLRVQHGITGGFAPPTPSAIHDFSFTPDTANNILLTSQIRELGTPSLLPAAAKSIAVSEETAAQLAELEAILRRLPASGPQGADVYGRDVGIMYARPGFEWVNAAPQGCGGYDDGSSGVTEDDKRAFQRAVDIADGLVKKGVAT
ncbi:hypothetical protein EWM64_g1430 [Hericium alpestre]|uniref:Uncharacterized protein n=1 Tax=Hericium alpestre TaxID=135208 RepID=A0A4Z0A7X8_9AGAM|nr:hypothetical protein EWM64_g1430 [Hericium alpestre]